MHEMGIAASVLDIVRQHVPEAQAPLVRLVRMRVGEMAGVQTESLSFCFEALVQGTPNQGARLEVNHVPATRTCRACRTSFASPALMVSCPVCGGAEVPFVGGSELLVEDV